MEQQDPITRAITGRDELALFSRLPYVLNTELSDDLAAGRRRPEWMWVALRGDRLLARAAWWSRPGDRLPRYLDILDVDDGVDGVPAAERPEFAARLVRTALSDILPAGTRPPEYTRFVPPDWREDTLVGPAVRARMTALESLGARLFVERLRLEWRPGTPIPQPRGRLTFRPVHDADELVALMTGVLAGTLDAHGRDELTRMTARESAVAQYDDELARYASPREWWRIATLPDGEPLGFVIPAHNGYNPVIAYIAVLPAYRGNGYVDDILAEGTRVPAAQDVPRIRAATDLGNVPMANAFRRAGFVNFEREINMTWR
ncbi:GNAT family N-acetyltransferase [Embleya sp. NPDC056575]|uniref:GNAT family N-acetyltransferase n=1 Tax=unclassified Embleya TaxID=2699296 RepID=UPI00368AD211